MYRYDNPYHRHDKYSMIDNKKLQEKINSLSKTFLVKFFIKLTSSMMIPDIYLQILKFETINRTNDDIKKILPYLKQLSYLNNYIVLQENPSNRDNESENQKIRNELAWILFYKFYQKLSIFKRAYEGKNLFFIILNGKLSKLHIIYKKEKISIEEYLLYILKMETLKENQIILKCNNLNKSVINIDIKNLKNYFDNDQKYLRYSYDQLKQKIKFDLINQGFKFINNRIISPSLNAYLKLGNLDTLNINDIINIKSRIHLFIGHFIKIGEFTKGDYIGDLSKNDNLEKISYFCEENCDVGYINKLKANNSTIFDSILKKIKNIFKNAKNKFFLFKDSIEENCLNYYVPLMIYKKYKKGDKIIVQNSQYEGIYLIIDGKVKINAISSFNDLTDTLISLKYSFMNFKDYASKIIKFQDIFTEFKNRNLKKELSITKDIKYRDIYSSNNYLNSLNAIKKIELYTMGVGDVLGLNELYDYKNELYNFEAECTSDEATLFFISKINFNNMMEKEKNLKNNAIVLVDLRAKYLIGKINSYRMYYKKLTFEYYKKSLKNNFNKIKISNSSLNVYDRKNEEKENDTPQKKTIKFCLNNISTMNKSKSMINFYSNKNSKRKNDDSNISTTKNFFTPQNKSILLPELKQTKNKMRSLRDIIKNIGGNKIENKMSYKKITSILKNKIRNQNRNNNINNINFRKMPYVVGNKFNSIDN